LQAPKPHLNASIQKDAPVFRPSFWLQNPEIRKTGAFCLKNVEKRPNEYTASIARFPGSVFRPLFPSNFGPKNRQFSPLNKRIKTHLFPRVFAPLFPLILATSRAPAPGPRVPLPFPPCCSPGPGIRSQVVYNSVTRNLHAFHIFRVSPSRNYFLPSRKKVCISSVVGVDYPHNGPQRGSNRRTFRR